MPDRPNFPIPDDLTPDTICLQLQVPNDPTWKQVFVGLLMQPGYWFNWERDDARSGRVLSRYWTKLFDQIDWSDMSCCCPEPNRTRLNPDGTYEISYDGGVTWESGIDQDPRYTSPEFPPVGGADGDDKRCKAANNVVQQLKDAQIGYSDQIGTVTTVLAMAAALAGLAALVFVTGGIGAFLIPAFFELAGILLGTSKAAYDALFDTDVWDYVLCQVYCAAAPDGSFTQENFSDLSADFDTHFSGSVALTIVSTMLAWQLPGLNNASRITSTANLDCSGCDCPTGCDPLDWDIYGAAHGTIIGRGDDWIEIESSASGGGHAYVLIRTPDLNTCCGVALVEFTSGTTNCAAGGMLCGVEPIEGNPQLYGVSLLDHCWNYIQLSSNDGALFTVKLTFSGACT